MKEVRMRAFGKPTEAPEIIEAAAGDPGPGQVAVAMEAAPINPSDLLLIRGHYGYRPPLPASLGTEGIGRIVAVGGAVDPTRIGERVLILPTLRSGTWQDQLIVGEDGIVPVDPAADPLQLAMLGVNPVTADILLRTFVDLAPGAWIGQTAANSAVGRYVVALAKHAGIRTLNVVRRPDISPELLELGADSVIVSGPDMGEQIEGVLGDERMSLLLDPVAGETCTSLTSWLEYGGTVVNYGGLSGASVTIAPADLIFRDIRVRGFWQKHWLDTAPHEDVVATYARLADLVTAGLLYAPVAATYPLEQYREALAHAAETGRDGKVLFTW